MLGDHQADERRHHTQEPDEINVPLGRAGRARELGELIAWLASERAAYVTGASYVIDGGLSLIVAEYQ